MTPDLIWRSIDVTFGLSALIMALLLIGRVVETRRARAQARERARGQATLQAFMFGADDPNLKVDLIRHAESVVQALSVIRGAEADRLIARLHEVGLIRAMADRLERQGGRADVHLIEAYAHLAGDDEAETLAGLLTRVKGRARRRAVIEGLLRAGAAPELDLTVRMLGGAGATSGDCDLIESVAAARPDEAEVLIVSEPAPAPAVRAALAAGLGRSGRFSAIAPLTRLVEGGDEIETLAGISALGALGHPLAGTAILHALYADNPRVRAAACRAAAQLKLTGLIEALSERLEDPDWDVRFAASDAMVAMGGIGRSRLRRLAAGGAGRVAALARDTLAEVAA